MKISFDVKTSLRYKPPDLYKILTNLLLSILIFGPLLIGTVMAYPEAAYAQDEKTDTIAFLDTRDLLLRA
jgi:hypothetical protein